MPGKPPIVVDEIPADRSLLATRIRELVEAALRAQDADLKGAAERIAEVTAQLSENSADVPLLLAPLDGLGQLSVNNPLEGPANPLAPPLKEIRVEDGVVRATAELGVAHEGAPGRAHGGWVAALLDHAVGRAVAVSGPPGMTVSLTVDYRHGTPYGVPLTVEAEVVGREGRKVRATGRVIADGEVTASASATLITVSGLPRSTLT